MPVCTTSAVTSRIGLEELKALVDEPLAKSAAVLEFEKDDGDKERIAEEKFRVFLDDNFEIADPRSFRDLPESRRKEIVQAAHQQGFSIRRLAHFTGLTPYAIHKFFR